MNHFTPSATPLGTLSNAFSLDLKVDMDNENTVQFLAVGSSVAIDKVVTG